MSRYKEDGWKLLEPKKAIEVAQAEVSAISKGKQWRMCIPPQTDDSDIVISGALMSASNRIKYLEQIIDDVYERVIHADRLKHDMTEDEAWKDAIALLEEARAVCSG